MEEIGVTNADPQTLNAEKEVSSNTKTSQKDPDDLKDSLTEVSGNLEDLVTDLDKPSESSKDQQNLPSAKDDTLTLNKEKGAEPSITSTKSSVRIAEYEAAVAERKEREEFERQEEQIERELEMEMEMKKMEMEMKKIEFEKKKQLAEVKRKSKLKADLRKLDTEFSDKSSRRSGSTITRSNSLPFADDRSHLSSWLDSLNGYDEQMITDQNNKSEDKFNKMSRDMQRELASVDEDANLPNYGRLKTVS